MRYSLLSFVVCPACAGDLVCWVREEQEARLTEGLFPPGDRVPEGPGLGPTPAWRKHTPLTAQLDAHGGSLAPPARSLVFVAEQGLLICGECGRWYPIEKGIPELLPDHLRDRERELDLFDASAAAMPRELREALAGYVPSGDAASDPGAHYKVAEIGIKAKVDDPGFFGPGYSSPFNPWNSEFTLYLIRLFGTAVPLLELKRGETVLDSGCGYAWTTEWLFKSGINAIGVDICRTYLEIGIQRIGPVRPHLLVADVENLPLRPGAFDAVLAYESFHHLPDRRAAMRGYDRALRPGGRVVLAEPGAAHEHAEVSVGAMEKYGILEKGMELNDVRAYAAGTELGSPEQVFVLRTNSDDVDRPLDTVFVRTHSVFEGNLFRLVRGGSAAAHRQIAVPRRRIWPGIKRRIKAALIRIGLD